MYRQQDTSAGAGNHFLSASTPTSSFSQTQFPSPLFQLDPGLQDSPQLLHPSNAIMAQPAVVRRSSSESQGSMQPPSSVSPRTTRSTAAKTIPNPSKRALPAKAVSESTITDAYVAFILYCNPQFALDIDLSSLRTAFNSPPKSDSKEFETFRLYELIAKLESKEIKTWGQLALDLGVDAPDVAKGQSVQKVQQYSVRLKRWMRAMHIDAFFEYLLGKEHPYFNKLPPATEPYPTAGRDGVQAEEDLAIRALDPAFRPKRGRRRNSDTELDNEAEQSQVNKQAKFDNGQDNDVPQSAYPMSAMPMSAHPDGMHDPWAITAYAPWVGRSNFPQTAVTASAPAHLRWELHGNATGGATPHPMTAQPTSMTAHIEAAFENEPRSAIAPSARRKRKHGPAVSSAWPSNSTPGAKPRGRPPANRNAQDGPYGTFPADPAMSGTNAGGRQIASEPVPSVEEQAAYQLTQMAPPLNRQNESGSRRGRLSLQVPQHTGGAVRLATPPRVLLNGEMNDSDGRSTSYTPIGESAPPLTKPVTQRQRVAANMQVADREMPGFAFEAIKRVLTSDLLRANLVGRQQRLSGEEAKRLADTVLERLNVPRQDTESSADDIARLTAASWLGLGEQFNVPLGPAVAQGKRITVTRFRTDAEGYEEIVSAREDDDGDIRELYDISWTISMAGCNGSFDLKGLSLGDRIPLEPDSHDILLRKSLAAARQIGNVDDGSIDLSIRQAAGAQPGEGRGSAGDGIDWKAKYRAMEFGSAIAIGELGRLRNRTLEKVLDVLLWQ